MRAFEIIGDPGEDILSRLLQYGLEPNPKTLKLENYPDAIKKEAKNYNDSLKSKEMNQILPALNKLTDIMGDPSVQKSISMEKSKPLMKTRDQFFHLVNKNNANLATRTMPEVGRQRPWTTKRPSKDELAGVRKLPLNMQAK